MKNRFYILLAVVFALASCADSGVDEGAGHPLTQKETLGAYSDGKNLFVYDDQLHQYAFNTGRRTFRIQTAGQDRYFSCTLDHMPVAGETVIIQVETKGISSLPSQEIQVQVLKAADGKLWLWEESKQLGFVIKLE